MPIAVEKTDGKIMGARVTLHGPSMWCGVGDSTCESIDFDFVPPRQVVHGGGTAIDVYVVGEAPGAQEAEAGQPFIGPSGQILDKALNSNETYAWSVRYGNTVCCYPTTDMGKGRNPTEKEVRWCSWYVQSDIMQHKPTLILAMGSVATGGLFPSLWGTPVGQTMQMELHWLGIPVVVCYHPSYILRQGGDTGKKYEPWRARIQEACETYAIPF